jgi:hypothetical protein
MGPRFERRHVDGDRELRRVDPVEVGDRSAQRDVEADV